MQNGRRMDGKHDFVGFFYIFFFIVCILHGGTIAEIAIILRFTCILPWMRQLYKNVFVIKVERDKNAIISKN